MHGYLPDPPDPRDYLYAARPQRPVLYAGPARTFEGLAGIPINQGADPICVACACAALKSAQEAHESGRALAFDPWGLYREIKARDGIPNVPGTYLRSALGLLADEGAMASDGCRYRIAAYVRLASPDEALDALRRGLFVAAGVLIETDRWARAEPDRPLGKDSLGRDGHAVLLCGYDAERGLLRLRNSWGARWCDGGAAWIEMDALQGADLWSVEDA